MISAWWLLLIAPVTIPFYLYNNSNETVTVTPELDVEGVIFYLGLEDS